MHRELKFNQNVALDASPNCRATVLDPQMLPCLRDQPIESILVQSMGKIQAFLLLFPYK